MSLSRKRTILVGIKMDKIRVHCIRKTSVRESPGFKRPRRGTAIHLNEEIHEIDVVNLLIKEGVGAGHVTEGTLGPLKDEGRGITGEALLEIQEVGCLTSMLCISQFQQCPSPPPGRSPGIRIFFFNKLANAPPPGQKSCPNAPG